MSKRKITTRKTEERKVTCPMKDKSWAMEQFPLSEGWEITRWGPATVGSVWVMTGYRYID